MNGKTRNAYSTLARKPEGKGKGRPRRRWADNIKMNPRGVGWCGIEWIDLAQGRDVWRALVNAVTNIWLS
jgi:hypothetical protein